MTQVKDVNSYIEEKFKATKVSDIRAYIIEKFNEGEKPQLYAKTARITAREGIIGEEIITKMKDGLTETKNVVKEKGDMVVTNPSGEQYILDAKTFDKKYEIDPENPEQYRPKGGAQEFLFVNENIQFTAPWGEEMKIKAGGAINVTKMDEGDIYGIQRQEFDETYAPCDEYGILLKINTDQRIK